MHPAGVPKRGTHRDLAVVHFVQRSSKLLWCRGCQLSTLWMECVELWHWECVCQLFIYILKSYCLTLVVELTNTLSMVVECSLGCTLHFLHLSVIGNQNPCAQWHMLSPWKFCPSNKVYRVHNCVKFIIQSYDSVPSSEHYEYITMLQTEFASNCMIGHHLGIITIQA